MKYKELMDHVTVTEEMRERILNSMEEKIQLRRKRKRLYLQGSLTVAAMVVFMTGAGLYMLKMPAHGRAPVQMEEAIPDIKEVSSVREMSELLGFTVPEPTMPFDVETTTYLVNWGELGEIDYEGKDQSAYFRISREEGDNSGDYNEYENITTEKINSTSVTLKGNQDNWNLAIWQDGEYSCSLGFSEGITVQQMRDIIEKIKCR